MSLRERRGNRVSRRSDPYRSPPCCPRPKCCLVKISAEGVLSEDKQTQLVEGVVRNCTHGTLSDVHVMVFGHPACPPQQPQGCDPCSTTEFTIATIAPLSEAQYSVPLDDGASGGCAGAAVEAEACVDNFAVDLNARGAGARPCDRSLITQSLRAELSTPRNVGCALPICSGRVPLPPACRVEVGAFGFLQGDVNPSLTVTVFNNTAVSIENIQYTVETTPPCAGLGGTIPGPVAPGDNQFTLVSLVACDPPAATACALVTSVDIQGDGALCCNFPRKSPEVPVPQPCRIELSAEGEVRGDDGQVLILTFQNNTSVAATNITVDITGFIPNEPDCVANDVLFNFPVPIAPDGGIEVREFFLSSPLGPCLEPVASAEVCLKSVQLESDQTLTYPPCPPTCATVDPMPQPLPTCNDVQIAAFGGVQETTQVLDVEILNNAAVDIQQLTLTVTANLPDGLTCTHETDPIPITIPSGGPPANLALNVYPDYCPAPASSATVCITQVLFENGVSLQCPEQCATVDPMPQPCPLVTIAPILLGNTYRVEFSNNTALPIEDIMYEITYETTTGQKAISGTVSNPVAPDATEVIVGADAETITFLVVCVNSYAFVDSILPPCTEVFCEQIGTPP